MEEIRWEAVQANITNRSDYVSMLWTLPFIRTLTDCVIPQWVKAFHSLLQEQERTVLRYLEISLEDASVLVSQLRQVLRRFSCDGTLVLQIKAQNSPIPLFGATSGSNEPSAFHMDSPTTQNILGGVVTVPQLFQSKSDPTPLQGLLRPPEMPLQQPVQSQGQSLSLSFGPGKTQL